MARVFARLARRELPGSEIVAEAMLAHPELVGGPTAPDTALMRARPGALAKRGAEGLMCLALPDGIGVAVKVEDGANRAALVATAAFLGVTDLLEAPVFNSRGEAVGRIRTGP
jgi:L-asparaginase II